MLERVINFVRTDGVQLFIIGGGPWNARAMMIDQNTIRYDTIEEFNVDSNAEYSALSSTRSQKKKLKQTTPVPL